MPTARSAPPTCRNWPFALDRDNLLHFEYETARFTDVDASRLSADRPARTGSARKMPVKRSAEELLLGVDAGTWQAHLAAKAVAGGLACRCRAWTSARSAAETHTATRRSAAAEVPGHRSTVRALARRDREGARHAGSIC
ncbi:MAG: hypothetical protein KIS84_09520 [Dokdonella sp.]|nr:hypothetical protein [Dokdonella sp.]